MKMDPFPVGPRSVGRSARRAAVPIAIAILLVVIGSMVIYFYGGQPEAKAPAQTSIAPLPKALAQPNAFKPLTVEQAIEANKELPFAQRRDDPARAFVLKVDSDNRGRAIDCLAQAVYYEAASEPVDGQRAVAQVVLNRMRHPAYPSTVCGVVYQGSERVMLGCQFTFTCDGSLLRRPNAAMFATARQIAIEALAGRVYAPVGHATNYHADYVLPYWASSLDKQIQIGRHIFYRLKGGLGASSAFAQRHGGREPAIVPQRAIILSAEALEQSDEVVASELTGSIPNSGPPNPIMEADAVIREPLAADSGAGVLLVGGPSPSLSKKKVTSATDCPSKDLSKIMPLGANELRSDSNKTC